MVAENIVHHQQTVNPTAKNNIQLFLESRRELIAQVAPKHLSVDRLLKVALLARGKDAKLAACSADSLLKCVIQAAELGLEAGGPQGHTYLVPFKGELTLIVGYRGMLELVRRSGLVSSIEAHVIHENDKYRVRFGLDPVLEHEPCLTGDPGRVVATYAVAKLRDAGVVFEVMTFHQLEAIRNRSMAKDSGPWKTDREEMYRKTVIRRLCKVLPQSAEMVRAQELEDDNHGPVIDVVAEAPAASEPNQKPTRTSAIKEKVGGMLATKVDRTSEPSPEEQAEIVAAEMAQSEPPPPGDEDAPR